MFIHNYFIFRSTLGQREGGGGAEREKEKEREIYFKMKHLKYIVIDDIILRN